MTAKKQKKSPRCDVKVSVMLTEAESARLDEFRASDPRVTRSHAAALLISKALDSATSKAAS